MGHLMLARIAVYVDREAICIQAKTRNNILFTNRGNMQSNVVPLHESRSEPDFPFEATSDIVVVEQVEEEASPGGIVLPGDYRKFPSGRVVAVGPGRTYACYMDAAGHTLTGYTVPTTIKVGDFVVMGKFQSGGEPIEIPNGKRYVMLRESDIGLRSKSGEFVKVRLAPARE